jgi:hypothetical protein
MERVPRREAKGVEREESATPALSYDRQCERNRSEKCARVQSFSCLYRKRLPWAILSPVSRGLAVYAREVCASLRVW